MQCVLSVQVPERLHNMQRFTLPLAIIIGIAAYYIYVNIPLLDGTHDFANHAVAIIQPLLIFSMLFLTFLTIGPRDLHFHKWHLWHLMIQIGLFTAIAYLLTKVPDTSHYRILIESAMLCLLCPTATAAAVVTRKLNGDSADITTYTILINIAIAVTAPALLPMAHPHPGLTFLPTFMMIIAKVFPLLICPLMAAWIVRKCLPGIASYLRQFRDLPFYLWAVALSLAIAVTVKAIVHSTVPAAYQVAIAGISLICCLFQFLIGKKIGKRYNKEIEGGQALGQKNTVFIIWLGYTFLSPVTAIAGGMYSVWHNVFNSWQLARHKEK